MPEWNYGDAYLRCPIEKGTAVFEDNSRLMTHDIFNELPAWMADADMIFTDSPWNRGNLSTFYTTADMRNLYTFEEFYKRLFDCVRKIAPRVCYLEIGKQYLADYIVEMRRIFKNVTFFNSSYYHRPENYCYIVRGGRNRHRIVLDGVDEEDAITRIMADEDYSCVADLCMGRGLVAIAAAGAGKRFVGTELNHKRLSVALEILSRKGAKYTMED